MDIFWWIYYAMDQKTLLSILTKACLCSLCQQHGLFRGSSFSCAVDVDHVASYFSFRWLSPRINVSYMCISFIVIAFFFSSGVGCWCFGGFVRWTLFSVGRSLRKWNNHSVCAGDGWIVHSWRWSIFISDKYLQILRINVWLYFYFTGYVISCE